MLFRVSGGKHPHRQILSRGLVCSRFMNDHVSDPHPGGEVESREPKPAQGTRPFALTFGVDRVGLIALKAPLVSAVVVLILSALAVMGLMRLQVDDSLSELFRSDTPEFRQYEEIDRRFPSSEFDVLAVVEGPSLLERPQLQAFADAVIDLQLADGVDGLVSMLSARGTPDALGYAPPIVPDELPEGAAYDAVIEALRTNDVVEGKFLSDDGQLALIVMSLERDLVLERGAKAVIGGILETAEQALEGTGLTVKLTGAPVMQLEIRNAVERDRNVYNGLGFLVGTLIAFLFFRRVSLTLIAVLGPIIAILWTLGVIGGLDFRLNLFINVITPLILVQGFSDSMHLVFSIRRDMMAGMDKREAARRAVREVAPACLLTSIVSILVLMSFVFSDSALIETFGYAALIGVTIAYLAVAVVVPTAAVLLVRPEPGPAIVPEEGDGGIGVLRRLTAGTVRTVIRWPLAFTLAGIAAIVLTGLTYLELEPRYSLADQVPDREHALAATDRLDQKLTGANPVHVMIQWEGDASLFAPRTMETIRAAHQVLEQEAGLGNVWSMESLRRWLAEAGDDRIETLQSYVAVLPEHLVRRFIAADEKAVLVTGRLPDIDASQIIPIVDKIDRALQPVRDAHPDYTISVTGLPAIAARNSAGLINELNWGLIGNMFLVFIFLAIAFRSILPGVASILPSLLPIFSTGALLWAVGEGMQFASIIAITVAFSVAIDSTIHFLNRYRLEEAELGPGKAHEALIRTGQIIGPVVVLTTIVLALGLGVTALSDLPSLRLFGRLAAICLLASVVAQLIVLPASIALYRRYVPYKA